MSIKSHGGMISTGGKLIIRPPELSGSLTSSHLVANQEDLCEVSNDFGLVRYLFVCKRSLTCRNILRHGTDEFTFTPKKGVLRIFIALKNPLDRDRWRNLVLGEGKPL
jgi:hypothetical protein